MNGRTRRETERKDTGKWLLVGAALVLGILAGIAALGIALAYLNPPEMPSTPVETVETTEEEPAPPTASPEANASDTQEQPLPPSEPPVEEEPPPEETNTSEIIEPPVEIPPEPPPETPLNSSEEPEPSTPPVNPPAGETYTDPDSGTTYTYTCNQNDPVAGCYWQSESDPWPSGSYSPGDTHTDVSGTIFTYACDTGYGCYWQADGEMMMPGGEEPYNNPDETPPGESPPSYNGYQEGDTMTDPQTGITYTYTCDGSGTCSWVIN